MTHDEIIAVIQAHKEGKPLEYYNLISNSWHTVREEGLTEILAGTSRGQSYRIAPEPPKPQYVPFESMEDFMPHADKWVRVKDSPGLSRIVLMDNNGLYVDGVYHGWKSVFGCLEFSDGTPCGKLVEK